MTWTPIRDAASFWKGSNGCGAFVWLQWFFWEDNVQSSEFRARAREESLRFRVSDTGHNCSGSRFRVRVEVIGLRIRAVGFGFRIWA